MLPVTCRSFVGQDGQVSSCPPATGEVLSHRVPETHESLIQEFVPQHDAGLSDVVSTTDAEIPVKQEALSSCNCSCRSWAQAGRGGAGHRRLHGGPVALERAIGFGRSRAAGR